LNRLENRVRKLEALRGTNPLQQLDDHGRKALLIILEAQIEAEQRGGTPEIAEAALAEHRMTLPEFDEASRQFTPAFWGRLEAHMERQR
jgi:hypothetical protein